MIYAIILLSLLTGCGWIPPVTLKHPTTQRTVQCEGEMYPLFDPQVAKLITTLQQNCIADYQRQGYEQSPG